MTVLNWTLPDGEVSVEETAGPDSFDHVAVALSRLRQQYRDKPNIVALVTALITPFQSLEEALWALLTQRSVTTAVGAQLDVLGKLVKQPRAGLDDDDYRRYIRARIATNRSDGLVEDLIKVAGLVIGDDAARIVIDQQGNAAVVVRILDVVLDDDLVSILVAFMRQTKSAGVRILVETLTDVDDETFFTAIAAFADGAMAVFDTDITVTSTAGFPDTGSLIIDEGLAVEETVTYGGITTTSFLAVSPLTQIHVDGSALVLTGAGAPGKGLGDSTDAAVGGKLMSVA